MAETYNDALEWAAKWIEDTLRNGPETNERTIEFGTNMAMTLRAAKLSDVDLPCTTAVDDAAISQALRPIRGCATDDQYVDVFERVSALLAAPRATGETTVELALAELREMFPTVTRRIDFFDRYDGDAVRVLVIVNGRECGNALTLADCMAQVRAAHTEGEK